MGISEITYPIKIFCFGNKDGILQNIFPEEINNENKEKWEQRRLKRTETFTENETKKTISQKIEWNATLYPDITIDEKDGNIDELFKDLTKKMDIPKYNFDENERNKNDPKAREKTKNVIIKFGKINSNCIINYMNDIPKTHLPQIAIITNENFDAEEEGLNDNRYLTIIRGYTKDEIQKKLFEFLWEKECYYNERGTIFLDKPDKIETNNYINIMLTGMSRSGKSTLINVLSEKLVTLESPFLESITTKIREYKIITSENGEFLTGLRFFDTPGLTIIRDTGRERSTVEEVKKAIDSKIEENKDSKDDIHLIYFMLKGYANSVYYVDFFQHIIEINKTRIKEGKKKIYVIFIFNQGNDASESSLFQFLKDNNLNELIEKINDQQNEEEPSYRKYINKNKNSENSSTKLKNNIVVLNLLKDKKSGQNVYGIDTLLQLTLYFVRKDNPYTENDFKELKKYENELKEPNIGKDKLKEIGNKVEAIYKELSKNNSFFSNIVSFESIIANAHYHNKIFMIKSKFLGYFLFFYFFSRNKISEYIHIFKKIEHNYKLYTDEIMIKPLIKNGDIGTFEGFNIVKIFNENYESKMEIKKNIELFEKSDFPIGSGFSINDKYYENIIPFPSFFRQYSFYGLLVDYFDNYLKETCCINYILKQKEIYDNIFNQLGKMKEKKNWEEFHPLFK